MERAAIGHPCVQPLLILAISFAKNPTVSAPVVSSYLTFDTATRTLVPAQRALFGLPIAPGVALFFLCSALAHFLASRHETGAELAAHGVPVTEFRAAVIIGSGSASFEILRHLTERLPIMITPRWVGTRCQPIGVRDVLDYLATRARAHDLPGSVPVLAERAIRRADGPRATD